MNLAMDLVLGASLTFSAGAKVLRILAQHCWPWQKTPCANTIETWLLRLGHYQLHSPLPGATDWVWLIDLTLTVGPHKVLVIAGCPQHQMPYGSSHLRPADLYLLHVAVLEKATHATIEPQLRQAAQRVGAPQVVLSDEGSEIVKAIGIWQQKQQEDPRPLTHVLDVAHAAANVLKKRWTAQPRWGKFLQGLTQTNQKLRQTSLAYLLSPRLRDKGRFMSVGVVLRFARRVLYWLDQPTAPQGLEQKYGWLRDHRFELQQWSYEQNLVQQTIAIAREHGWSTGTLMDLETLWSTSPPPGGNREVVVPLREFAQKMADRVPRGHWLPASTEALESAFGRWKRFLEVGPITGLSALVLALGCIFHPVPKAQTKQAWEKTPIKKVLRWVRRQLGTTLTKLRQGFTRQTNATLT